MYHWHTAFGWPSPGIVWAKGHASPAEQPLLRKNLHGTWPSASFFFVDSLALASALPAFGGACPFSSRSSRAVRARSSPPRPRPPRRRRCEDSDRPCTSDKMYKGGSSVLSCVAIHTGSCCLSGCVGIFATRTSWCGVHTGAPSSLGACTGARFLSFASLTFSEGADAKSDSSADRDDTCVLRTSSTCKCGNAYDVPSWANTASGKLLPLSTSSSKCTAEPHISIGSGSRNKL